MCGKCPWVGGCCIILLKSFWSGPLWNWFRCLLGNFQCFSASDRSVSSGYRFLIIHCVDCYVFIFGTVWTVSLITPLEVVASLFTRSPLEVGNRYFMALLVFSWGVLVMFYSDWILWFHLKILLSQHQLPPIVSCKCLLVHLSVLLSKTGSHVSFCLLLWYVVVWGIYANTKQCLW